MNAPLTAFDPIRVAHAVGLLMLPGPPVKASLWNRNAFDPLSLPRNSPSRPLDTAPPARRAEGGRP